MRKIQETRPLAESLRARIAKREGGSPRPLDTDAVLHRQSLEEITRLNAEITALSKNVIEMTGEDFDATLNNLRRMGASIDGDNAYKRDLCDSIIGTLKFGYDDRCPPPEGHWAQTFWDIGREHGAAKQELASLRAEIETLRADQARLDSGMIMTFDRDEFGETHQTERHGMNLRAAIDEAIGRSHPINPA